MGTAGQSQERGTIPKEGAWYLVLAASAFTCLMGFVWAMRNGLELVGILPPSGWTNTEFHYVLGFSAVTFYILAFLFLLRRRRLFLALYIVGAVQRWIFWASQAQIEGFPIHIGFFVLAADALVLMTSIRWYLAPGPKK